MGQPQSVPLDQQLFKMRFSAKQFAHMAKKAEKDAKAERLKVKKAIEQGNNEGARIYAQNAIRQKNQALNYLRMGSRLDGVAARLQTAVQMQRVTATMTGITKSMDDALTSMDLERISAVMSKFEQQFEDLDVTSAYVEGAMGDSMASTTPEDQVDTLISEVADEHGLQVGETLGDAQLDVPRGQATPAAATAQPDDADALNDRLKALRAKST
eukprot:a847120_99.p1 GENE.a847120_99~~a847120_99.p1  ORF type:complete len:226 (-),score=87.44 a847120_99:145-783(-)